MLSDVVRICSNDSYAEKKNPVVTLGFGFLDVQKCFVWTGVVPQRLPLAIYLTAKPTARRAYETCLVRFWAKWYRKTV